MMSFIRMSSIICALSIIMSNGILLAYHSEQVSEVHTWHTITSFNGSWYGSLHVLTDNEQVITEQDDFNMLYSLTLSQQLEPDPKQSNSRICVFLISAERAACPYIVPVSFHGKTTCLWESVEGRGENFSIQ
ncbi:unnamed protein product [Adineta ricciae]|uniref:Uncharacterized protein n=1 Tax=Adineta ricciae TaxID=249248 RepID=A0A815D6H2_ADIRI|nr:unnamed protein product [Adineta ricciae]